MSLCECVGVVSIGVTKGHTLMALDSGRREACSGRPIRGRIRFQPLSSSCKCGLRAKMWVCGGGHKKILGKASRDTVVTSNTSTLNRPLGPTRAMKLRIT